MSARSTGDVMRTRIARGIAEVHAAKGRPPKIRELLAHLGLTSTGHLGARRE